MNFKELRNRVNDNIGRDNQSSRLHTQINYDILSELKKIHRLSETPSKEYSFSILSTDTSPITQDMPVDFFLPLGVKAINSEGNRVSSIEMPRERFFRWEPASLPPAGGDIQEQIPSEPAQIYNTSENFDYDYSFGWYFEFMEGLWKFYGKLPFDGTIKVFYAYIPTLITDDTDNVNVVPFYEDVIVEGATIRMLNRLIARANTEIEILALKTSLTGYLNSYRKIFADLSGALHKTSELEPNMIHPFWLANDPSQEAY